MRLVLAACLAALPLLSQLNYERPRPVMGETRPAPPFSGSWQQDNAGAWLWRGTLQSPGANALRLHFRDFHAGPGSLTVSSVNREVTSTATGDGIYNDGDFWSTMTPGDTVLLEFRPGTGSVDPPAELPFAIPSIAHFFGAAKAGASRDLLANCHVDPFNYPQWQPAEGPVALVYFHVASQNLWTVCTGTLVADKNKSRRPLFVTAHHCIGNQEDARTVETYWNFQTTATTTYPDGAQYNFNLQAWTPASLATSLTKVTGANLLFTVSESEGDGTLLELSGLPPNPQFAAINTQELALNSTTGTIHHPDGSWKRLASGPRVNITSGVEAGILVDGLFRPSDYYYKIAETTGQTEAGSSGSAVLTPDYLVSGLLSYGPLLGCHDPRTHGVYGRFSTFLPRAQTYLNNTPANSCLVDTSAVNLTIASSQNSGSFQVVAPSNCPWAVAADDDFITVNQRVGSGPGTVAWQITANPGDSSRTGMISIIGEQRRVVHIQQKGSSSAPLYLDTANDPFSEFINYIKIRQVYAAYGCPADKYCPSIPTTRGMMAQFIIESIFGNVLFPYQQTPYFSDVPANHPAFSYVQKMKEMGITAGCTTTTYCPDDPVTRGQMAVFIVRAMLLKNGLTVGSQFTTASQPYFSDVDATNVFFPFIQRMKELGITAGCGPSTYCPNDPNTRGQIAVFITRGLFALLEGRPQ